VVVVGISLLLAPCQPFGAPAAQVGSFALATFLRGSAVVVYWGHEIPVPLAPGQPYGAPAARRHCACGANGIVRVGDVSTRECGGCPLGSRNSGAYGTVPAGRWRSINTPAAQERAFSLLALRKYAYGAPRECARPGWSGLIQSTAGICRFKAGMRTFRRVPHR